MKIIAAAALAMLAPSALFGQAVAQPIEMPAQATSDHARLALALNSDAAHEAGVRAVIRDMRTVMMRDPNIVLMERECEGIVDLVVSTASPFLTEYAGVERAVTVAEMTALIERELTGEEARQLAIFYESESGQRVLAEVNANLNFERTIGGSIPDDPDAPIRIDRKDAEADLQRTVANTISGMSAEELERIGREIRSIPAFAKFQTLTPKLNALRLDIANRDLIAGFDGRMEAAIETAMATGLEECGL